jgi:hypothetical protein
MVVLCRVSIDGVHIFPAGAEDDSTPAHTQAIVHMPLGCSLQ